MLVAGIGYGEAAISIHSCNGWYYCCTCIVC